MMLLPTEYDSLRTKLMDSPSLTLDPINAQEANEFYTYAKNSTGKTRLGVTGTMKVAQILGLHGLVGNLVSTRVAQSLLAILEFFGDRNWNDTQTRETVFAEIASLSSDPQNMATLIAKYRKDAPLNPIATPYNYQGGTLSADNIRTITAKLRQWGFQSISDPRDVILYLTAGALPGFSAANFKTTLGFKAQDTFEAPERTLALQMLLELDIAQLLNSEARSQWWNERAADRGSSLTLSAHSSTTSSTIPSPTLAGTHDLDAIGKKIIELGLMRRNPASVIQYFTSEGNIKEVGDSVLRFKNLLGFKGNFTPARRQVVWIMLQQLEAREIRDPKTRQAWLEKALSGKIDGITTDEHFDFVRLIMPNSTSVSQGKNADTHTVEPSAGLSDIPHPTPNTGASTAAAPINATRRLVPIVVDDRSPHKKAFDARLALAAGNRPDDDKTLEPLDNPIQRFMDAFSLGHLNVYAKRLLDCTTFVLSEIEVSQDVHFLHPVLATAIILNRTSEGTLAEALPKIFRKTPPGRGWILSWAQDIEIMILGDVFGIHHKHATNWCAHQNPPVAWTDFMAGAIFEAHSHITKQKSENGGASVLGMQWPVKPHFEREIPRAFKLYTETSEAQALMTPHGAAKKPATTATAETAAAAIVERRIPARRR